MKKIFRLISFILLGVLLFAGTLHIIPDQYEEIYQRSIVNQYDYFRQIKENKVIFIGNSSLLFGFDIDRMEELTGRKCVILGGHAGYGLPFFMEMSKSNLSSGDVIVIEFPGETNLDNYNVDLLLTGIGKRYDMYRFFPKYQRKTALMRYPKYIKDNFNYMLDGGYHSSGVYSAEAMDYRGAMDYERAECEIPFPYSEAVEQDEQYLWFSMGGFDASPGYCKYVNSYVDYCNSLGVQVLITVPCYLDEAVTSTEAEMDSYDESWRTTINAPYVSEQKNYIFTRDYIYNQAAHCNSKGAILRTEKLYKDIKDYLH